VKTAKLSKSIFVKRVYEKPDKSDGFRVLVDRLWPRGVKKENANIDEWAKDIAPQKNLVTWYHEDKEQRYKEFSKKYKIYLKEQSDLIKKLTTEHKILTLITGVKDIKHSHIPTLKACMEHEGIL